MSSVVRATRGQWTNGLHRLSQCLEIYLESFIVYSLYPELSLFLKRSKIRAVSGCKSYDNIRFYNDVYLGDVYCWCFVTFTIASYGNEKDTQNILLFMLTVMYLFLW